MDPGSAKRSFKIVRILTKVQSRILLGLGALAAVSIATVAVLLSAGFPAPEPTLAIAPATIPLTVPPSSAPTITPSPTQTPATTPSPEEPAATPAGPTATSAPPAFDLGKYYAGCMQVEGAQNPMDHLYALGQLSFPTDLSAEAQSRLAQPVIIRSSCNISRGNQPRAIVLHATRGELAPSLSEFQRAASTSAHYIIDRDGQIYQMVPESLAAFHVACFNRAQCVASCPICNGPDGAFREPSIQSIGIELVNLGQIADPGKFTGPFYEDYLMSFGYRFWEDYPEEQLAALRILVEDIRNRWEIPYDMVMGHYRINENSDPGPALNLFWPRNGNPVHPPIFPALEP